MSDVFICVVVNKKTLAGFSIEKTLQSHTEERGALLTGRSMALLCFLKTVVFL